MTQIPRAIALSVMLAFGPGFMAKAGQNGTAVTLGPDPVLGGGAYSSGGGLTVAVEPRNSGGRLAICGIWAQSDRLTAVLRQSARDVLATGNISVDGQTVLRDLRFLQQAQPAKSYAGAAAGCALTDMPWQAGAQIDIRIPRQLVYFNRSRDGGKEIRYGPSEDDNPAMTAGSLMPSAWTSFTVKGGRYGMDRPTQ